jgi:protein farnesyltransferase subunit beta
MTVVRTPDAQFKDSPLKQTHSSRSQFGAELECEPFFVDLPTLPPSQIDHLRDTGLLAGATATTGGDNDNEGNNNEDSLDICLLKEKHITYLSQIWFQDLRSSFVTLDSSRPWILYWCLHGCDLLDHTPATEICQSIVQTLESCWTPATVRLPRNALLKEDPILSTSSAINDSNDNTDNTDNDSSSEFVEFVGGGFGGGPGQMPHAATNYAAVLALCILAGSGEYACPAAYTLLEQKRRSLYIWILSLKAKDGTGSFRMQHDGEIDVRATYCVMAVAKLLHICTDTLTTGAMNYISSCQTYEGGFGAEPFTEAHGGYTFCATAAVQLLEGWSQVNSVPALTGWLARRQMGFEGGFNGRSNKLVDGCYSFWQGGALAIVSRLHYVTKSKDDSDPWLSDLSNDSTTSPSTTTDTDDDLTLLFDEGMLQRYILLCAQDVNGGLRDKPSSNRDFYHSCYNLSGLSVAQHYASRNNKNESEPPAFGHAQKSRVAQTHPCYNIRIDHARQALDHFAAMGWPQT